MGKKNSTIDDQIVDFLKEKGFITCTSDLAKFRISQDGNQVDVAQHIGTGKEIFHLGANNGKVEHYYDNDNSFTVTGLEKGLKVVYSVSTATPDGEAFPLAALKVCIEEAMEKVKISKN